MNNPEIILTPLEMRLIAICYETDTPDKCMDAIGQISWEEHRDNTAEEKWELETTKELMFAKGNLLVLEERQKVDSSN